MTPKRAIARSGAGKRPQSKPRRLGLPLWHPAALIATWFGAGLLPWMPGTWGSLAALPFAWAIRSYCGTAGLSIAAVVLFLVGWWAATRVAAASGRTDPGFIVVDEVAAQWLVLVAAALDPRAYAAGFLLFRLFDIIKPRPIDWVERRVGGGLGIMLDDVVAAIYALVILAIGEGALGVRP
jgi:phosphatidylglycerophosphatase A